MISMELLRVMPLIFALIRRFLPPHLNEKERQTTGLGGDVPITQQNSNQDANGNLPMTHRTRRKRIPSCAPASFTRVTRSQQVCLRD